MTALLLVACNAQALEDVDCPPNGTELTYENFGAPFFSAWCNHCHGGTKGHSSRSFRTLEDVRADKERIFATAAGDNVSMPPGPDDPSEAERAKLAEWLACGAP